MPSILEILAFCIVEIISNPLVVVGTGTLLIFFLLDGNL